MSTITFRGEGSMRTPRWLSGDVVKEGELTEEQWEALGVVRQRWQLDDPMTLLPGIGYIMVDVGSMFLGIEKDGHTHS